jgi:hypothetical protein
LAAITILAPSAASRKAMALPIPRLAPVISTVLFFNNIANCLRVEDKKTAGKAGYFHRRYPSLAVKLIVKESVKFALAVNKNGD